MESMHDGFSSQMHAKTLPSQRKCVPTTEVTRVTNRHLPEGPPYCLSHSFQPTDPKFLWCLFSEHHLKSICYHIFEELPDEV